MSGHITMPPGAPSGPPPGWYNDPGGAPALRWWDGREWAPHTRPLDAQAPPALKDEPAARTKPGPWTWTVAAAPLTALGIAAVGALFISPGSGVSGPVLAGWLGAALLSWIASEMDARSLKRSGDARLAGWGMICIIFSGWAYLLVRAIKLRTGADWGIFAACAALLVFVLAGIYPLANAVKDSNAVFDQAGLQNAIAAKLAKDAGSPVNVSCPASPEMTAGTRFTCLATASDGSTATVNVTMQDNRGDVVWQVAGS